MSSSSNVLSCATQESGDTNRRDLFSASMPPAITDDDNGSRAPVAGGPRNDFTLSSSPFHPQNNVFSLLGPSLEEQVQRLHTTNADDSAYYMTVLSIQQVPDASRARGPSNASSPPLRHVLDRLLTITPPRAGSRTHRQVANNPHQSPREHLVSILERALAVVEDEAPFDGSYASLTSSSSNILGEVEEENSQ